MQLHSKIEAFRKSVGSSPIRRAKSVTPPSVDKLKRDSNNPRLLKQYHCVWGVADDYGTEPMKGCFTKSIQERGPGSESPLKIAAMYFHSQRDTVGLPSVLVEDEIGLYSEVEVLKGIQVCDELVIRHNAGVVNNGSYGFNYIWDKMVYDEKEDKIRMYECDLFEISYVFKGSQVETFGVRGPNGEYTDDLLEEETEKFLKKISKKDRLELRCLIDRHISLAKEQPLETRQEALKPIIEPIRSGLDYNYLINQILNK